MIKIKQFQLQYGLFADGVIGKKTLNKININNRISTFLDKLHETAILI
jgi:murein L,D-transpeptidase YcbB/YkuD